MTTVNPVPATSRGRSLPSAAAPENGRPSEPDAHTSVAVITLGCARNDVDSEELAARLDTGGFSLVADAESAEVVVVNTCGFVEAAKKDSVDAVLEASDLKSRGRTRAVVAVGCLAERYGRELAESLPEADAVLGFDDYPDIPARLRSILAGETHPAHVPVDRRRMLPVTPVERAARARVSLPGHGQEAPDLSPAMTPATGPRAVRRRLGSGPMAPLKIASGCDRRCSFCAIPSFRGSFVSRPPSAIVDEARWLAQHGVRELLLVSENSTSYGKDLGDIRLLESLLAALTVVDGIRRVRVSYLQPAEVRPTLVHAIASTTGVAQYFDLSFQHASAGVLRRMRRFGDGGRFVQLLDQIRAASPDAGARSNFIVGFPGETEADVEELCAFLGAARLDAIGIFGYSDEDGTEGATLSGHLDEREIAARVRHVCDIAEELTAQRAEDRVDDCVDVLLERIDGSTAEGRADCQGPDVDGCTTVTRLRAGAAVGDIVPGRVTASSGVDLIAESARP
jgi:ribosomal protein S12 methylthiotransferase